METRVIKYEVFSFFLSAAGQREGRKKNLQGLSWFKKKAFGMFFSVARHPTDPFTTLEPQDQEIGEIY